MKKSILTLVVVTSIGLSGCVGIPVLEGSYVSHAGILESNEGIHSVELQKGTTVSQLHQAILDMVKNNSKEFELKADDPNPDRAVVWTFSNKYNQPVTFYAYNADSDVYLGIDIGGESKADRDINDIYYLEDLVQKYLK